MYVKLTRFDNRPVWLNASFIVTVEPRRDGNGAVVVPIGDGLDYDVRETPEQVLAMLEGAPEPKVVPVPVSDCLTKTPADVSPEPEKPETPVAPVAAEPEKKPRKRVTRKTKTADEKAPAAEKKPRAAKKAAEPEKPAEASAPAEPFKLELSDDQIERLRKMAPKSLTKIKNTLATQFHVGDVGGTVSALAEKGVYRIDGNHIVWPVTEAADKPEHEA